MRLNYLAAEALTKQHADSEKINASRKEIRLRKKKKETENEEENEDVVEETLKKAL